MPRTIGVIGGSGLYEMEGLGDLERVRLETPFGEPSDAYVVGTLTPSSGTPPLGAARLAFLPRHGRGHRLLPSEINYRANIFGMKQLGVEWLVSLSAVGSMREDVAPGDLVVVDQFFDRTVGRASTFFGEGIAAHVGFADPVCAELAGVVAESARAAGARVHEGGTYLCMEGPQFSTRAESRIYRSWGVDVIGMTNLTEAKLAREAEICYATVALVTDYDCWHASEEAVSVEAVVATLRKNADMAKRVVREAAARIPAERRCACPEALRGAIMTDRAAIPPEAAERLRLIAGKYLSQ
ncbi:MAG: S-methyl-5'-thioadenosine phosphorylase [Myxococcota bacterium]